jgi:protein phosphatase
VLRRLGDPADVARELVRLANEGGGRDNITVVVVDVVDDGGRAEAASAALAGEPQTATHATTLVGDEVDDDAEDGERRRRRFGRRRRNEPRHRAARTGRRVTWRVVVFIALILALAGGVVATIQWYGQAAYFVSFEDDEVAIYRGRPGGVLWIEPELVETSGLPRDRVPDDTLDSLTAGKEQGSLSEARAYIERISERADEMSPTTTTTTRSGGTGRTTTTRARTTTTANP